MFTNIFEHKISTQAKSYKEDGGVFVRCLNVFYNSINVTGDSAMIGAEEPVLFTAATTQIQTTGIPTSPVHRSGHSADITNTGAALQTVHYDGQGITTDLGKVQVQKVIIRRFDPGPGIADPQTVPNQKWQYRGCVSMA